MKKLEWLGRFVIESNREEPLARFRDMIATELVRKAGKLLKDNVESFQYLLVDILTSVKTR